ncbi:hypothetical protein, partial [Achromobacter sp. GbtcB20]|uniref:hypothetical protein n=1 Tax=Achromobacter sp. GbtcB20 TaxID=2824765 RepID=UPI001C2FF359
APQQSEFFLSLADRSSVFGATHHSGNLCCFLASDEILMNKFTDRFASNSTIHGPFFGSEKCWRRPC